MFIIFDTHYLVRIDERHYRYCKAIVTLAFMFTISDANSLFSPSLELENDRMRFEVENYLSVEHRHLPEYKVTSSKQLCDGRDSVSDQKSISIKINLGKTVTDKRRSLRQHIGVSTYEFRLPRHPSQPTRAKRATGVVRIDEASDRYSVVVRVSARSKSREPDGIVGC